MLSFEKTLFLGFEDDNGNYFTDFFKDVLVDKQHPQFWMKF